jgi:hypothetical protein
VSVVIGSSCWHRNGTAGERALPGDAAGDRRGGGVDELLGGLGVDVNRERDGAVAQDFADHFGGWPARSRCWTLGLSSGPAGAAGRPGTSRGMSAEVSDRDITRTLRENYRNFKGRQLPIA